MSKFNNRTIRELQKLEFYHPELNRALTKLLEEGHSRRMAVFMIERATIARSKIRDVFPELGIKIPAWFYSGFEGPTHGLAIYLPYADRITDFAKWYAKDFSKGSLFEEVMTYWWDNFDDECFNEFNFLDDNHPDRPSYRQYIRGRMFLSMISRSGELSNANTCLIGRHNAFEAEALMTSLGKEDEPNYAQLEKYRSTDETLRNAIWRPSIKSLDLPNRVPTHQYPRASASQLRLLARGYSPRDLYPDFTAKEAHEFLTRDEDESEQLKYDYSRDHLEWFAKRHGIVQLRSVRAMRWFALHKARETFRQFSQPSGIVPPFNVPMGCRLDEIQDSHIVRLSDTPKTVFARVDETIREAYRDTDRNNPELHLPLTELPDWCSKLPEGFRALNTPYELVREGESMHHCVGAYSESTRRRHSLCLSALTTHGRSTIEVSFDGSRCTQNKGVHNTPGAPEHLDALRSSTGLAFQMVRGWSNADFDGNFIDAGWVQFFGEQTQDIQAVMARVIAGQHANPVQVPTGYWSGRQVHPELMPARTLALSTRIGELSGISCVNNSPSRR